MTHAPFKPKTFNQLCSAMQTGAEVEINGFVGYILQIQKEDGSGTNWNVLLGSSSGKHPVFVHTEE